MADVRQAMERSGRSEVQDVLAAHARTIGSLLPAQWQDPQRMFRLLQQTTTRNPRLLQAMREAPDAYIAALCEVAALGLEPGTVSGECAIIPYRISGTDGGWDIQVQVMYRGYLTLILRTGEVAAARGEAICEGDQVGLPDVLSTSPPAIHQALRDRGEPYAAIGWARMRDGSTIWRIADADRCLDAERASRSDAWTASSSSRREMFAKTGIRHLAKQAPQLREASRAAGIEVAREAGRSASYRELATVRDQDGGDDA